MTIDTPYLLYLGHSQDPVEVKTSRGIAVFRPDICVAEFRHDDCALSLGLPRMSFSEAAAAGARTLVLGVANAGGRLGDALVDDAIAAMEAGLDVAAGLHERLAADRRLADAASRLNRKLHDVRQPPTGLRVGNGRPRAGHRLLTVGTDCSVGKMYTSLALVQGLEGRGLSASFRATGQTGILIAGEGVPLDAVVADFISGAAEQLAPERQDGGWDVIEGQGSLFHPSFAGVSLGLLHGAQPEAIVLCHDPARAHIRGLPGRALPTLAECLEANLSAAQLTSPRVRAVGVALNTSSVDADAARDLCSKVSAELDLPCVDPHRHGVESILDRLLNPDTSSMAAA